MGSTKAPSFLESSDKMDKFRIVCQLGVDHFNVLCIPINKQVAQVIEAALDMRAQLSHSHTLTVADFATHFIGNDQDRYIKIVTPLANAIGHFVDLADLS